MRVARLVSILAVLLFAGGAAASEMYEIDRKIPLGDTYDVPVELSSLGMNITRVKIKDIPSAEKVASAGKMSSFKPDVEAWVVSAAGAEMRIFLEVTLEDDQGNVYLSCKRAKNFDPGEDDQVSVCVGMPMYTRDWAKVTTYHLKASVGKR